MFAPLLSSMSGLARRLRRLACVPSRRRRSHSRMWISLARTARRSITTVVSPMHCGLRFNSGMVTSLLSERVAPFSPISVRATSPRAAKAHLFHRSPTRYCSTPASWEAPGRRAILNLGGIANLTVLHEDPTRVIGFDTGPANSPLDRLARQLSDGELEYDRDGQFARAGKVNERLLADLLAEDLYLARRPPKSTGFEMYGDAFVGRSAARHGAYDSNLMATLVEFTAKTIALGICQCAELGAPIAEIVVAGGGVKNMALIERIAALVAPVPIRRSDDLGVPSDVREAMVFAVLADMTLRGMPAFLPPVTGASAPKLLGKLSFP